MKYLGNPQSGSLANQTFSRNRYGQYARTRAIPVQPRTVAQQNIRNIFGSAAKSWSQQTEDIRNAWIAYAATKTFYDQLGQPYQQSGMQAYVGAYTLLKLTNADVSPLIPPSEWTPPVGIITSISNVGSIIYSPPPENDYVFVYASPLSSQGTSFFGQLRLIKVLSSTDTTPVNIKTAWQSVYGSWQSGYRICWRFRYCKFGISLGPVEQHIIYTA